MASNDVEALQQEMKKRCAEIDRLMKVASRARHDQASKRAAEGGIPQLTVAELTPTERGVYDAEIKNARESGQEGELAEQKAMLNALIRGGRFDSVTINHRAKDGPAFFAFNSSDLDSPLGQHTLLQQEMYRAFQYLSDAMVGFGVLEVEECSKLQDSFWQMMSKK